MPNLATETSPAAQIPAARRPPILISLLLTMVGILTALLALEGAIRILQAVTKPAKPWNDRPAFYFRPKTSSSLQGNTYQAVKPANTFRIAVVGDSVSFGSHIQFDDTFSSRLARMLNLDSAPQMVEVINYGVPGYSTINEVEVTKQALNEQANLVVLQITLNDPEIEQLNVAHEKNLQRFGAFRPEGWKKTLFGYSRALGWIAERIHNRGTRDAYRDYFFDLYDQPASRDAFIASLRVIAETTQQKKIPLIAVVFPLFGFPIDDHYPFSPIHARINEWLNTLQIAHLDLSSAFQDIPSDRLQVMPGRDMHPNEIAHRIAAESIYRFLFTQKLLPTELFAQYLYACRNALHGPSFKGRFPSRRARAAVNECVQ